MTNDFGMTAVLLLFLAAAIERTVEVLIAPFDQASVALKRGVAIALSLAIGAGLAFGLRLDLVGAADGRYKPDRDAGPRRHGDCPRRRQRSHS
jgi:hypothetical protein